VCARHHERLMSKTAYMHYIEYQYVQTYQIDENQALKMENTVILRVPGNDDNSHALPVILSALYTPFDQGKSKKFSAYVIVRNILYRNRR
jgi:Icc-related predicted phosphoesterase